jgi:hypothetical protein
MSNDLPNGPAASFSIHAAPVKAIRYSHAAVTLEFSNYAYPSITIYTGSHALAVDLVDAINAVVAKHSKPEAE